ncbi:MAG: LysE family translocator [Cyclobacteriaceae bacterium]|nr:LysE family translocator [Cyclobacteriaceae bacterium]
MLYYFTYGFSLGLAAGISPGPVLALVISETINHGRKEGIKVAMALLITDIPIILFSMIVLYYLRDSNLIFGLLSVFGGFFLAYLSKDNFQAGEKVPVVRTRINSFRKGIIVNLLNPAPYVFWLTIGTPTLMKGWERSVLDSILFIVAFYICLVGSKVVVAYMVNKSKGFLRSSTYRWINFFLGILLLLMAVKFVYDGYNYLFIEL